MQELRGYMKQRPEVLGQHTCVSIAKSSGVWKRIPLLKDNEGMLPPSLIVVGDRRRALAAGELLDECFILHDRVAELSGPNASGRVNVILGVFEYMGKPLPLTILETQMGCSAQDINAWEILINSREDGYMLHGQPIPSGSINVIRAGTCGGIIAPDGDPLHSLDLDIGHVVAADFSIGAGAVLRQRMGFEGSLAPGDAGRFIERWKEKGYGFTPDGRWLKMDSSPSLTSAIADSCRSSGLTCHFGGNFTKDSLYLESDEAWNVRLRTDYGVLSSEMEHLGLAFLAHELTGKGILVRNGLVSTVVGTVPGGSFAAPGSKEEKAAKKSEEMMLEAAMVALWKQVHEG